jgi:recombination protein RecA
MERIQLKSKEVQFFSSGSTLLDLALGGGWALSRVFNIVGDRSTGKTLLAIEAFANFKQSFPKGRMRYAEAEAAFDDVFAEQLGFPQEVTRPEELLHTVEEFRDDLYKFTKDGGPSLYILDSLDSLTDEAEIKKWEKSMKKKEDPEDETKETGSYGVGKPKQMSQMFRLLTRDMNKLDCSLGIISQIRDNIGVKFGEHHTRSGGKALDFYASQVLWLAQTQKLERTSKGQARAVGISVLGNVKKCKVGYPFRKVDFDIIFGYGVDDEMSMIDWLLEIKALEKEAAKDVRNRLEKAREKQDYPMLKEIRSQLKQDTTSIWNEIEKSLAPPIRKYGNQTTECKPVDCQRTK